jgi:hypothetical protein
MLFKINQQSFVIVKNSILEEPFSIQFKHLSVVANLQQMRPLFMQNIFTIIVHFDCYIINLNNIYYVKITEIFKLYVLKLKLH